MSLGINIPVKVWLRMTVTIRGLIYNNIELPIKPSSNVMQDNKNPR